MSVVSADTVVVFFSESCIVLLHVREELKKQAQSLIDSHHLFNVERTSRHGTRYSLIISIRSYSEVSKVTQLNLMIVT